MNTLVTGDIKKSLIMFALPLLLGNVFQQLYNTADSIIVGNYIGDSALAAVNSSGSIINLLVSLFMGCALGAGVCISNYYGANNDVEVSKTVHTTIAFALASALILTVVGTLLCPVILKLVNVAPEVISESTTYLQIYFLGSIGLVVYNMSSGILRAVGDSKTPLYFLILASIINIMLDLIFVIVFKMGIAGVALATVIAQGTSAICTILTLMNSTGTYKLYLGKIKFHLDSLKKIIKIGIPSSIQNGIVSLSNVTVQANINSFGAVAMAGAGSYMKLEGFALMPILSFSMALTTFVGQNIGAKQYTRVKEGAKIGLQLSIIVIVILSILQLLFANQLLTIFSKNQEIVEVGKLMMKTVMPGYILLTITHTFAGVLRGVGLTKIPMYVMIICWCCCRIVWVTFSMNYFNEIVYVFMGWPLTWTVSGIFMIFYYCKVNWLKPID